LQLIKEIENGKKIKDVVKEFGVKPSTLSTLYKNLDSLKRQGNENPTTLKSKKIHSCKHTQLANTVALLVLQARDNNKPLSGTLIQKEARLYTEAMNIDEDIEGSNVSIQNCLSFC
jgi:sugar phosphate isomerase/epimerase